MGWLALLAFVPAMVVTNTPFPIPSDAVLIAFAGGQPPALAIVAAVVGAICAGIGGLLELRLLDRIVDRQDVPHHGRWFYASVVAAAALPIPFTAIRLLLLRGRPRPWAYATAIAVGRCPRYLAEALLVTQLAGPTWISLAAFSAVVVVFAIRRRR